MDNRAEARVSAQKACVINTQHQWQYLRMVDGQDWFYCCWCLKKGIG